MKFLLNYRKQITFLIIGGFVAIIDPFILFTLNKVFDFSLNSSVSVAYFIGLLFHFILNNRFSFKNSELNIKTKIIRYLIVVLINYLLNLLIINTCIKVFHFHLLAAKYTAVLICMAISYLGMNKFVFKNNK